MSTRTYEYKTSTKRPFKKLKPITARHKPMAKTEQKSIDYSKYPTAHIAYRKYTINRMRQNPTGAIAPFKKFKSIWFGKKPSEAIGGINK